MGARENSRNTFESHLSISIQENINFDAILFFNWHSLHARLNSYYEAWSFKKSKHKMIKA